MNDILKLYNQQLRSMCDVLSKEEFSINKNVRIKRDICDYVVSWNLTEKSAAENVSKVSTYYRRSRRELLWRIYQHDKPGNLSKCLESEGYITVSSGRLMVLSLAHGLPKPVHDIRRANSTKDINDYLSVSFRAFGEEVNQKDHEYYSTIMHSKNVHLYTCYWDDQPIGSGRLDMCFGTAFALLFGGGVVPEYRGKGIYKALVCTRALVAQSRGFEYLGTEARNTSALILEKMGFTPVAHETLWKLPAQ